MERMWNQLRNQKTGRAASPRGMTLVEVMLVITIIASVMAVIGVNVFGMFSQAQTENARLKIEKLRGQVQQKFLIGATNELPENLDELTEGPNPIVESEDGLKDPWGNKYVYEKKDDQDFVIYSAGPDGQKGTKDDVNPSEE